MDAECAHNLQPDPRARAVARGIHDVSRAALPRLGRARGGCGGSGDGISGDNHRSLEATLRGLRRRDVPRARSRASGRQNAGLRARFRERDEARGQRTIWRRAGKINRLQAFAARVLRNAYFPSRLHFDENRTKAANRENQPGARNCARRAASRRDGRRVFHRSAPRKIRRTGRCGGCGTRHRTNPWNFTMAVIARFPARARAAPEIEAARCRSADCSAAGSLPIAISGRNSGARGGE